jgi:hypothetical protein
MTTSKSYRLTVSKCYYFSCPAELVWSVDMARLEKEFELHEISITGAQMHGCLSLGQQWH